MNHQQEKFANKNLATNRAGAAFTGPQNARIISFAGNSTALPQMKFFFTGVKYASGTVEKTFTPGAFAPDALRTRM